MNSTYWLNPAIFMIETLTSLYSFALILRLLMQWSGADYYNPVCQFIVRITRLPLKPLKRILPTIGRTDTATIALVWLVQISGTTLIIVLQGGGIALLPLAVWSLADTLGLVLDVIFFAIVARTILSWFNLSYNPSVSLLYSLTTPMMRAAQNLLPPMGGLDLSPLLLLFLLHLSKLLMLPPLQQLAASLG